MPRSQRSNSVVSTESRRRRPSRYRPPSPSDPTCPYTHSQTIASTIAQQWASEPESVRQAYSVAEQDVVEEFEVEEILMRSAKARKRARARRAKWIATHEPIVFIEMEMQELGALSSEPEPECMIETREGDVVRTEEGVVPGQGDDSQEIERAMSIELSDGGQLGTPAEEVESQRNSTDHPRTVKP
ncbi:hypothetical protein BDY19DRAFT_993731 [Irpex rosettiformis]|uniref:Uncharacterized protein n=1 Tax=Irpex rosettiformis TaxID=378272 RepID=A0ACB8U490_9APHY|nr:hypothetical protein BDY19DRAFT_993731 [Irpex rosettiformis]